MKVSDYIVRALEKENITDVFGIPGVGCGHFTDSLKKSSIRNHITYHEQGAAFAACAYGQATKNIGVAYATAGPGATNLLTGIANAYVDSVPALYLVGDKDSDTLRGNLKIRQKASQEVGIVGMAHPVTKWSYQIQNAGEVRFALEKALYIARNGRPGPVLLDIPSDIQRAEYEDQSGFISEPETGYHVDEITTALRRSSRPLFLVGGGAKQAGLIEDLKTISARCGIPVAATIVCDDELFGYENYIGFLGIDGDPGANQAVASCDLLVCFGARLNLKEVGKNRNDFASQAHIIRIDVDPAELEYQIGSEKAVHADLKAVIPALLAHATEIGEKDAWVCGSIRRNDGASTSNSAAFQLVTEVASKIPENVDISVGIGSHRRWFLSGRMVKTGWRIFQSAGLASMGYALPAAIGVHFASGRPVVCVDGDGGLLMNVQELQLIRREQLPITVVVCNNRCLGEIMEFQKKIFNKNYMGTTEETGYLSADFEAIAAAFHLAYRKVVSTADLEALEFNFTRPELIELLLPTNIERETS